MVSYSSCDIKCTFTECTNIRAGLTVFIVVKFKGKTFHKVKWQEIDTEEIKLYWVQQWGKFHLVHKDDREARLSLSL